jgi:hypothetical protein
LGSCELDWLIEVGGRLEAGTAGGSDCFIAGAAGSDEDPDGVDDEPGIGGKLDALRGDGRGGLGAP